MNPWDITHRIVAGQRVNVGGMETTAKANTTRLEPRALTGHNPRVSRPSAILEPFAHTCENGVMTTWEQPRTPASTSGDVVLPAKRSRKRWGRGLIAAAVASAALIGAASPAMAASPFDYLVPYVKDSANLSRVYWTAVQPNAGMGGIEVIAMFDTNNPPCLPDNGIGDHPAWACLSERKIAVYLPNLDDLAKRTGNAEVTTHLVVGHEFGHFGLVQTGDRDLDESHAMCASGAYLRVVSERAKRFDADTADAVSKKALETDAGVNSYKTGWNKGITICSKGW